MHNDVNWIFICISYDKNDKYNFYYGKLKVKSYESYWYYVKSEGKIGRLFDVIKFNRSILSNINQKFDNVFFASIDNPFIQLSLSKLKYEFAKSLMMALQIFGAKVYIISQLIEGLYKKLYIPW